MIDKYWVLKVVWVLILS